MKPKLKKLLDEGFTALCGSDTNAVLERERDGVKLILLYDLITDKVIERYKNIPDFAEDSPTTRYDEVGK